MAYFDNAQKMKAAAPFQGRPLALLAKDAFGYAIVSVFALAVDWGGLHLLAQRSNLPKFFVMALPFLLGLAVAYSLTIVFVYKNDRRSLTHRAEIIVFLITGLLGLALNILCLEFFSALFQCPIEIAKAPTIFLVFGFNFFSRRYFLTNPFALKFFAKADVSKIRSS